MKHVFDVYPVAEIAIARAEGSTLWDAQGNEYLDFYGGHAVISIGHTHPHYVARIREQLDRIGFYSNSVQMPLQYELAEKLVNVSGKKEYRLFMCNSGAEANENALKLASFHTGRNKVVAFTGAFHGRTSLAVAVTDNPSIVAPVNQTPHVTFLPFGDTDATAAYFHRNGSELAAVIVEPIQGVGGIRVASDEFLQTLRELCDRYGVLLIADEVQCGYGRTGNFFAADHSGIMADIYTMAKGMGNGFPVGGLLIAPHIRAAHGMLGTTFGGNHLACAAALAVLDVIIEEDLLQYARQAGEEISRSLQNLTGVSDVRGRGLMIGFDVDEAHKDLRKQLLSVHRIFTGVAGALTVRLLPALNVKQKDIRRLMDALRHCMVLQD